MVESTAAPWLLYGSKRLEKESEGVWFSRESKRRARKKVIKSVYVWLEMS